MPFESSAARLWKTLARAEREAAARAFWQRPPREAAAAAAREVVDLLRVRPQAFAKVPVAVRVRALAGLANPSEAVAEALLVALHVDERRQLLADFLDALGIAHEEGLIAEDAEPATPSLEAVRASAAALVARHTAPAVRVYWNVLWLQDRERWAALEPVADEI
ncbi:MAG TPA: hypothetical protein VI942_08750 [Thermoanaerobaculia bacterium]|nr:hypothetical protein [Thermoanaerobaculia bacterium]